MTFKYLPEASVVAALVAVFGMTWPGQPALAQSAVPRARSATMRRAADRGYLGVGVIETAPERVRALTQQEGGGVEVKRVDAESPAARAGLRENDVIVEVNGKQIGNVDDFIRPIAEASAGTKVTLTVWRQASSQPGTRAAKLSLSATLESRPADAFLTDPDDSLPPFPDVPVTRNGQLSALLGQSPLVGFEGEMLTEQLAQYFGVKEGVLVRTVSPRTPAERAGLKAGDVVTKVNGTPVTSPREISGIIHASGKRVVSFTVVRNKKEVTLDIELAGLRGPVSDREDL